LQSRLDQGFAVSARDQRRRRDRKLEASEISGAEQIGERLAGSTPRDQGGKAGFVRRMGR
jgi:hypothetical protein